MAIVNYTLPFGGVQAQNWATISPLHNQHANAVNDLLYGPVGHQEDDQQDDDGYYKNSPYAPPQTPPHHHQQYRHAPNSNNNNNNNNNNNYLPPHPTYQQHPSTLKAQPTVEQHHTSMPTRATSNGYQKQGRTYGEGSYSQIPSRNQPQQPQQQQQNTQYYNQGAYNSRNYNTNQQQIPPTASASVKQPSVSTINSSSNLNRRTGNDAAAAPATRGNVNGRNGNPIPFGGAVDGAAAADPGGSIGGIPNRPPEFKRVTVGQGSRTQVHAILDYDDDDEYYDDDDDATEGEFFYIFTL
jgi:hypothetical protein